MILYLKTVNTGMLEKMGHYVVKKRCDEYWEEAGLNNDYFE